jgi:hypothetical protein
VILITILSRKKNIEFKMPYNAINLTYLLGIKSMGSFRKKNGNRPMIQSQISKRQKLQSQFCKFNQLEL